MKYSFIILMALFLVSTGCSKSDDPAPACRINEMISPTDGSTLITYNTDGKPTLLTNTDLKLSFTYNGNKVEILMTINGNFFRKYTVTVLQNGLTEAVRMETDISGNTWRNTAYTYNGEQMIRETRTYSDNSQVLVITYKWENGNPVSRNDGTEEIKYEYYADKAFDRNLDFADGQNWEVLRPRNLTKAVIYGTDRTDFTYSFDGDGKIISKTAKDGSSTVTYTYKYECK